MEDDLHYRRWIEIKFYYLLKDIMYMCGDLFKTLEWLDTLVLNNAYNPLYVKQYGMELLQTPWAAPAKEEVVILATQFDYPMRAVKRWIGVHNKTYYIILKGEKENPHLFLPRFQPDADEEIEKFLKFIDTLRGLGQ